MRPGKSIFREWTLKYVARVPNPRLGERLVTPVSTRQVSGFVGGKNESREGKESSIRPEWFNALGMAEQYVCVCVCVKRYEKK